MLQTNMFTCEIGFDTTENEPSKVCQDLGFLMFCYVFCKFDLPRFTRICRVSQAEVVSTGASRATTPGTPAPANAPSDAGLRVPPEPARHNAAGVAGRRPGVPPEVRTRMKNNE